MSGGFLQERKLREKSEMMIASSVQLTAGKEGALRFDGSLGITAALRPGCVYHEAVHSNLCIWHVAPVACCPTYQRKEVERQE